MSPSGAATDPESLRKEEHAPEEDDGEAGEGGAGRGEGDEEERDRGSLFVQALLPELSDASLHALAEELSLEVPGFRPGRVPRPLLLARLSRSKDCTDELVLDAYLDEHLDVGRVIAGSSLKELEADLPSLVARFGKLPVVLWLKGDRRKGANRLAVRLLRGRLQGVPGETGDAAAGRPAQQEPATAASRRTSPSGAGSASKHQAELSRLRRQVRKLEKEKKAAQREAGEAGRALGELRKRVAELEEKLASAERLPASHGPVVIETSAALARDERLDAAHRRNERLKRLRPLRERGPNGGLSETGVGGRARRRRLSRKAAPHGRLRELGRPLSGKRVLVVGGDSFHAAYRRIVESLGGSFDALKAGDTGRAEAKAMAADIVVVMTAYVSHKVNDRVRQSLERAGRKERLALANSTGHRSLLRALRPFFRQRRT